MIRTTDISLRSKIILLFLGLIVVSSLSTIIAVVIATQNSVESQAREKLTIGQKVFDQLLDIRSTQLFDSAQVLTADFGFKTAVLDSDRSTIASVLDNHGARINADLMVLLDLEGSLIASSENTGSLSDFSVGALLAQAEQDGGVATTVMISGKLYQILMLPINAPITVAWSIVGFEIDTALANQLKSLTALEVSFKGIDSEQRMFELTTIERAQESNPTVLESNGMWQRLALNDQEYLALISPLAEEAGYEIRAILSTSLQDAYETFSPLKIQILTISVIALVVSAIIAFVLSKNITRPVSNLVSAAERISAGDYSGNILEGKFKQNEIAKLAQSLSHMQQGIAEREERILNQVYHDTLTGLNNRIYIQEEIQLLIKKMVDPDSLQDAAQTETDTEIGQQESDITFAILQVNIRKFKDVNDTFGYQTGDKLLIAMANRLRSVCCADDIAARLGADEFLLVLNTSDDSNQSKESLQYRLKDIAMRLAGQYRVDELDIPVTLACGVVMYPGHGQRTNQLLRMVDIAVHDAYEQKQLLCFYQPGSDEKHLKQIRLISDLKVAMQENQLTMFYQPKLDVKQQRVTQVEALIRWIHPELGFIPPDEFIGLAEQSGLMPSLTRWVIKDVCREAENWRSQGIAVEMAVNLSAYDLVNDDLSVIIQDTIQYHGLKSSDLILEVTESAMMENPQQSLTILHELKEMGFRLAVDDYGTGYSSLSQLKDMPVDELKIDMSFVLKLDESTYDQAIVKSTIEMSHQLGLTVVAEGVENLASWQLLAKWGCDKLQGYYISRPQKSSDFIEWYRTYDIPEEIKASA